MRVCINKATGKLIEGSPTQPLSTLLQNAINGGFQEEEVEVKEVTDAEYLVIMATTKTIDCEALPYGEKRRREYPPMADYLDGIVKGDQAQVQAYIEACLAVKNKYPKG